MGLVAGAQQPHVLLPRPPLLLASVTDACHPACAAEYDSTAPASFTALRFSDPKELMEAVGNAGLQDLECKELQVSRLGEIPSLLHKAMRQAISVLLPPLAAGRLLAEKRRVVGCNAPDAASHQGQWQGHGARVGMSSSVVRRAMTLLCGWCASMQAAVSKAQQQRPGEDVFGEARQKMQALLSANGCLTPAGDLDCCTNSCWLISAKKPG